MDRYSLELFGYPSVNIKVVGLGMMMLRHYYQK